MSDDGLDGLGLGGGSAGLGSDAKPGPVKSAHTRPHAKAQRARDDVKDDRRNMAPIRAIEGHAVKALPMGIAPRTPGR